MIPTKEGVHNICLVDACDADVLRLRNDNPALNIWRRDFDGRLPEEDIKGRVVYLLPTRAEKYAEVLSRKDVMIGEDYNIVYSI